MADDGLFHFVAETYSSNTSGRAFQKVRGNNFVIDDPAPPPYDGPGESPNAGEYFVSGITGCAVLMMHRIARAEDLPLEGCHVTMDVALDREKERGEHTLLDVAHMHFSFAGVDDEQASRLVHIFKAT